MNLKNTPLSILDFLGYFVPGSLCVYLVILFRSAYLGEVQQQILATIKFDVTDLLPFFLAAYVLGHLLSFLSALTIERYAFWTYGYPSTYLLQQQTTRNPTKIHWGNKLYQVINCLFLTPVWFLNTIFGKCAGLDELYVRKLNQDQIKIVKGKIKVFVSNLKNTSNTHDQAKIFDHGDFFHFLYNYVITNAPQHAGKLQNHIAQSGFLRTLSVIFIFSFWIGWLLIARGALSYEIFILLEGLSLIASYICFLGFLKFNRRYVCETLIAFAVIYQSNE